MLQQKNKSEKERSFGRRNFLHISTFTIAGAGLVTLALTGEFEDSEGFSNWDGMPKKKGLENIDNRYFQMSEYLRTQRSEYLGNTDGSLTSFKQLDFELQIAKTLGALLLAQDLLTNAEFNISGYSFRSGVILYEEPEDRQFRLSDDYDYSSESRHHKRVKEGSGYKECVEEARLTRKIIAELLKSASKALPESSGSLKSDPVNVKILADCVVKLPVLARRIENKVQLVGANVLHRYYKGGHTSKAIGRTEYLEESISALKYLQRVAEKGHPEK